MNVTCQDCRSVFRVDPAKVPPNGVRARCSVCGAIVRIAVGAMTPLTNPSVARSLTPLRSTAVPATTPSGLPGIRRTGTPAMVDAVEPNRPYVSRPTPSISTPGIFPPAVAPVAHSPVAPEPTPVNVPLMAQDASAVADAPQAALPTMDFSEPVVAETFQPPLPAAPVAMPSPAFVPPAPAPVVQRPLVPPPPPSPGQLVGMPEPTPFPAEVRTAPPTPDARRVINPFLRSDPMTRAKRLARALVSDMVAYQPAKRAEGLSNGTLKQLFRDEIRKSYDEYVEQVGREAAESTAFFQDALNEVLADGKRVF